MEIRPSAELRNNYPLMSKICKEESKPIFLTVNGRGDTVLLSVAEYERLYKLEVASRVMQAKQEIEEGKTYTHDEVIANLMSILQE